MSLRDSRPQPARILLVEDSQVQTLFVKTALADLPQLDLVHVAEDGVEAMEFLLTHIPHLRLKVRRAFGGMLSNCSKVRWIGVGSARRRLVVP